jgi:hypothetical protein
MTRLYPSRTRPSPTTAEFIWRVLGVVALAGCSALGWYLFELSRRYHFDNEIAGFLRAAGASARALFRVDSVLALLVYPFAVLVVLILVSLFIWMRRDR